MAGTAAGKPEYNVLTDVFAATKLFSTWPTDIYSSGFEVTRFARSSVGTNFHDSAGEVHYAKMPYDRPAGI